MLTKDMIEDFREQFDDLMPYQLDTATGNEVCNLALAQLEAGWKSIESAPKDGKFLAWRPGWTYPAIMRNHGAYFAGEFGEVDDPTHWKPLDLPSPPAEKEVANG